MSLKSIGQSAQLSAQALIPGIDLGLTSQDAAPVKSARSRNRAGAWSADLSRTAAYLMAQATNEAEEEAVQRLYDDALKEGPDFINYRRGSGFMDAPKLAMDRNMFARIMFKLDLIERGTYRGCRTKGKQGLPRTAARVLKALLGLALRFGRVFPSLEGLARLSCVCKQTVVNCLKVLELYGFVVRHRRIKRIRTALGIKVVQESNAYTLHEPVKGLGAMAVALFSRTSESKKQSASPLESLSISTWEGKTPRREVPDGVYNGLYAAWDAV